MVTDYLITAGSIPAFLSDTKNLNFREWNAKYGTAFKKESSFKGSIRRYAQNVTDSFSKVIKETYIKPKTAPPTVPKVKPKTPPKAKPITPLIDKKQPKPQPLKIYKSKNAKKGKTGSGRKFVRKGTVKPKQFVNKKKLSSGGRFIENIYTNWNRLAPLLENAWDLRGHKPPESQEMQATLFISETVTISSGGLAQNEYSTTVGTGVVEKSTGITIVMLSNEINHKISSYLKKRRALPSITRVKLVRADLTVRRWY